MNQGSNSIPSHISATKGVHCHTSTMISEGSARFESATHRLRARPSDSRKWLSTPRLGLNISAQMRAIATGVATMGSRIMVRIRPFAGISRLKSTAIAMPSTSCTGTATPVNRSVFLMPL